MASPAVISHWHHTAEDFNTSALAFYDAIESSLKEAEAPVTFSRTEWNEGGVLSAKRTYLRVGFQRFDFDICAAPFGKSFFFSWWLTKKTPDLAMLGCMVIVGLPIVFLLLLSGFGLIKGTLFFLVLLVVGVIAIKSVATSDSGGLDEALAALPLIGPLYGRFFKPVTYYSEDTRLIFEESVHRAVLNTVEGLLKAKGARALAPNEQRIESRGVLQ